MGQSSTFQDYTTFKVIQLNYPMFSEGPHVTITLQLPVVNVLLQGDKGLTFQQTCGEAGYILWGVHKKHWGKLFDTHTSDFLLFFYSVYLFLSNLLSDMIGGPLVSFTRHTLYSTWHVSWALNVIPGNSIVFKLKWVIFNF